MTEYTTPKSGDFDIIVDSELRMLQASSAQGALVAVDWANHRIMVLHPRNEAQPGEERHKVLFECKLKKPKLARIMVPINKLIKHPEGQWNPVDMEEVLDDVKWTKFLGHLADVWGISARWPTSEESKNEIELVGDYDQIQTYLKENAPEDELKQSQYPIRCRVCGCMDSYRVSDRSTNQGTTFYQITPELMHNVTAEGFTGVCMSCAKENLS